MHLLNEIARISSHRGDRDKKQILMPAKIVARVVRGRTTESVHRGHYVVIDGDRNIVASAGDPNTITFMRSAAKPIQAMHLITAGTANAFGFSDEEIALACASHSGEPRHTRIASLMLERIGLTEAHLRCGVHLPFNEKEADRMMREGEHPTQLHNNCSGKHIAMLATAKFTGNDLGEYENIEHPVQQMILADVSRMSELDSGRIQIAIDGCAAPNFAMPLASMAISFLNLVSASNAVSGSSATAAERIVEAMVKFPEIVGGTERLDTMLMQATAGRLVSKVGAEGVWLCGILPCERFPRGAAIALKIEDGDDKRARPVVAVRLLERLGVLAEGLLPTLSPMPIKNRRGDLVGQVEAII